MPKQLTKLQQEKRDRLRTRTTNNPAGVESKPQITITDVSATAVREPVSKRPYVLVSLKTDAGISGIGEAAPDAMPQTTVSRILAHKHQLIGKDALAAEALRNSLLKDFGGHGVSWLGAINMALLDIAGKISKVPTYEVLGGKTRDQVRAMAVLDSQPDAALKQSVTDAYAAGHRAFVVPMPASQGTARGPAFYRAIREFLDGLRASVGDEVDFVLDADGRLHPRDAIELARQLESFHPLWLDEPCRDASITTLRNISEETVTPIGLGRRVTGNQTFQELLREDAVSVLRPDLAYHGISEIRKAAALAETYYVAVAPSNRGGPLATAAALHLAASIPNFFIQEFPLPNDPADREMRQKLITAPIESPKDGFLPLPTAAGLGIELNVEAVQRYRIDS